MSSDKTRKKFVTHITERSKGLENALLSIKDFRQFLIYNTTVTDELIGEFEKYNAGLKQKYASLKVDINSIKDRMYHILSLIELVENNSTPQWTPITPTVPTLRVSHLHSALFYIVEKKNKPSEAGAENEVKRMTTNSRKL